VSQYSADWNASSIAVSPELGVVAREATNELLEVEAAVLGLMR